MCMDVFLLGGLIGVGGVIGYVGTVATVTLTSALVCFIIIKSK